MRYDNYNNNNSDENEKIWKENEHLKHIINQQGLEIRRLASLNMTNNILTNENQRFSKENNWQKQRISDLEKKIVILARENEKLNNLFVSLLNNTQSAA
jgi:D-mannonate dehydratase